MAADKIFKVLTEFQFEIQDAVANSNQLQGALGRISGAAQNALLSLDTLKGFLASGIGLNVGLYGILGSAIKSSEIFSRQTLSFANLLGGNLEYLQGSVQTFNDRLAVSEKILKNIARTSREFGLDEQSLLNTTKMTAALLIPKGLAGDNLGSAVDLARMFEKSAPLLGVDPFLAQGQLIRAIEGNSSMGDTLFRRLVSETSAFADFRGQASPSKSFNSLSTEKRFERIQKALKQFSSDADVTARNADLLSSKFRILKNQLWGLDGALRPIGRVLSGPIKQTLDTVSQYIDSKGRKISEDFSKFIESFLANPEALYHNLRQLAALQKDVQRAGTVAKTLGLGSLVVAMGRLALKIPFVSQGLAALGAAIAKLAGFATLGALWASVKTSILAMKNAGLLFRVVMLGLGFVLKRILMPLALFSGIFQILSRAMSHAEVMNLQFFAENADRLFPILDRLKDLLMQIAGPFITVIDSLARGIAPLFSFQTYGGIAITTLEMLAAGLEKIANVVTPAVAGLVAGSTVAYAFFTNATEQFRIAWDTLGKVIVQGVHGILKNVVNAFQEIKKFNFSAAWEQLTKPFEFKGIESMPGMSFEQYGQVWNSALDDFFDENIRRLNDPNLENKAITNQSVNIAKVEINQDFKENAEPDRIAHSLMKTIVDAAKNPLQSRGRSLMSGFVAR